MDQRLYKNGRFVMEERDPSIGESTLVGGSSRWVREEKDSSCYQLCIDNQNGLIFSSSASSISGTVSHRGDNAASRSILIRDEKSDEIARIGLRPKNTGTVFESSFTWNLKSKSDSYVKSGRYTISLVEQSNGKVIECCSVKCMVADTRMILLTTDLLKSCSQSLADPALKRVISVYADIIRDIEVRIIEGLKDKLFDEPYFVARTTAGFIEEIYNDIKNNNSTSKFRPLIEEFVSKNPGLGLPTDSEELGLRTLFDFLVNYMADPEDQARGTAMIKCEYRNFTANDRSVILSALVSGILPHCRVFAPQKHVIGRMANALVEHLLRVGIRYVCAKHVDKSIAICRATIA